MAEKTILDKLIEEALKDNYFLDLLQTNPTEAFKKIGVTNVTSDMMKTGYDLHQSLRHVAEVFKGGYYYIDFPMP